MKRHLQILFTLITISILAASQPSAQTATPAVSDTDAPTASTFTPGPTLTPTLTPEPTETLFPTWTPAPSLTPSPTPPTYVREGQTIPVPDEPITAKNADQIVELVRLGKGAIQEVQLSPNRVYLLVRTTIGIYGYYADTLEQVWAWEDPTGIAAMAVPKLDRWIAAATNDGRIALLIYQRGSMFSQIISGYENINGLAFSSDGDLLAAIGDKGVTIWQVGETEPLYEYPEILGEKVKFTPNGEGIFAFSMESAELFAVDTGKQQKAINGVWLLEFTPDGKYLSNGTAVFDGNTGEFLFKHSKGGYVKFSPNGQYLVLNYSMQRAEVWNVWSQEKIFDLYSPYAGNPGSIGKVSKAASSPDNGDLGAFYFGFAFSPDSTKLAIATEIDAVEIWDLDSGRFERQIPCHGEKLIFRKNSRLVVYGDGGMKQIEPNSGITINQALNFTSSPYYNNAFEFSENANKIIFSPAGDLLFAGNTAWQISESSRSYRFGDEFVLAVSKDGQFFYTFDNNEDLVRTRTTSDFEVVEEVEIIQPEGAAEGFLYSKSWFHINQPIISLNNNIFSGRVNSGEVKPFHSWDLETGLEIEELFTYGHSGLFDQTGNYLIIYYRGFKIIDVETYQEIVSVDSDNYGIVTLSTDNSYLLYGNSSRTEKYKINQAFTVEFIDEFPYPNDDWFLGQSISPNNKVIVGQQNEYNIAFLDFDNGERIITIPAHLDEIVSIAFSPDGKYLATSSDDGTVRIWGIPPGE